MLPIVAVLTSVKSLPVSSLYRCLLKIFAASHTVVAFAGARELFALAPCCALGRGSDMQVDCVGSNVYICGNVEEGYQKEGGRHLEGLLSWCQIYIKEAGGGEGGEHSSFTQLRVAQSKQHMQSIACHAFNLPLSGALLGAEQTPQSTRSQGSCVNVRTQSGGRAQMPRTSLWLRLYSSSADSSQ